MRVGALALLWTPVAALVPAALEPSRGSRIRADRAPLLLASAALTDRPAAVAARAALPAIAAVVALSADALAGTQLLIARCWAPTRARRALLRHRQRAQVGPRVLVFAAVAAALYPAVRSRRAASAMAVAGSSSRLSRARRGSARGSAA